MLQYFVDFDSCSQFICELLRYAEGIFLLYFVLFDSFARIVCNAVERLNVLNVLAISFSSLNYFWGLFGSCVAIIRIYL